VYGSLIFIGPGGGAEAETEVLGAADVLAAGGADGPLEHAVLAAANANAAVLVRSCVLTSYTVTPPVARCLPALFSFR
jgi:hypothetical protein